VCSENPEARVIVTVKALTMEFFSARLEPRVRESITVLKREFFTERPEVMVIEEVGLRVQLVGAPA